MLEFLKFWHVRVTSHQNLQYIGLSESPICQKFQYIAIYMSEFPICESFWNCDVSEFLICHQFQYARISTENLHTLEFLIHQNLRNLNTSEILICQKFQYVGISIRISNVGASVRRFITSEFLKF